VARANLQALHDPFLNAFVDVTSGAYDLFIGDDIDTLRSNASVGAKAWALADIVLTLVPPERPQAGFYRGMRCETSKDGR
jgi:hypothetical protein